MMIIFGAGSYGKMALEFYGSDAVLCFADNNPAKAGTQFCGKDVVSFEEYLALAPLHQTVIATAACASIAKQLREAGVEEYRFYSKNYDAIIKMMDEYNDSLLGKVVFFGIDDCTDILLKDVLRRGLSAERIVLAAQDGDELIGKEYMGFPVTLLESAVPGASCILISSESDIYSLQVQAREYENTGVNIFNPFIQKRYYDTNELIFSPYDLPGSDLTEDEWIERNRGNLAIPEINSCAEALNRKQPLFDHIEIETLNRCNGTCAFCPVSAGHDTREKKVMTWELFKSIIDQLCELRYSGRLCTFSNNEPFLDERIIEFNEYAKANLPNARLHLFTNGTLLSLEKFKAISALLDELIIDNYDQNLELIPNSVAIQRYCEENPALKEKVTIVLRKPQEILTSRGGDAPNRREKPSYASARCIRPFKQMIVRPDGKLSLCCNDAYGKSTLGDLQTQSITQAWFGEGYQKVRKALMAGRGNLAQCKYCDTFFLS